LPDRSHSGDIIAINDGIRYWAENNLVFNVVFVKAMAIAPMVVDTV